MSSRIIFVLGPTAVGKSAFALQKARENGAEIISADAFQVYRGLDIGTAKLRLDEREGITHHFIDICNPDQGYSVAEFARHAREMLIKDQPWIICGGTALYCHALLYGYQFMNQNGSTHRIRLQQRLESEGLFVLVEELMTIDSELTLDFKNPRRVLRALEYYYDTGILPSLRMQRSLSPVFEAHCVGILCEKEQLHARINKRVDEMLKSGWIDEACLLLRKYPRNSPAFQAIGYQEIFDFLEDKLFYDEMVDLIKLRTRQLAKRQMTWFKRFAHVHWISN